MGNHGGYGNNIEGIPLPGDIPQVESSAAPYRDEPAGAFDPESGDNAEYAVDYFDAVDADDPHEPYIANKDDRRWSAGIADEENDEGPASFGELDNDWSEGIFPETEPLSVKGKVEKQSDEEINGIELQPDNIEYGPD